MNTGDLFDSRFRLRDRLGAGGMSVVWRAHDEVLGRDVAVKVLSPHLAPDTALLAHIRDEARAVARLRHPNIVDVYDFGEAPGPLPYVVMEVVEGRSLSKVLATDALAWRPAVRIGAQVAAALAAAHHRGVVHRDVKPGNVMVAGARVKLVDFGISAASGDDDRAAGELLGTPAYLAPERLEHGVVRPATDVYALGLLLYRCLAGRLPWQASTATQMLRAHRYQEPADLPRIADLPAEVVALCRRCLAKDPAHRPTAAAAALVLAAAVGVDPAVLALPGEEGEVSRPAAAGGRALAVLRRFGARHPRRLAGVAGAVALLVSGGVVAASRYDSPQTPVEAQAGAVGGPQAQPVVPVPAPAPKCTVSYAVAAAGGRFTGKVSIANTGSVPIPAAPLTFTLPGAQRLRSGEPGNWQQNGRTITARIADLAPGSRHAATIRGTYQNVSAMPDRFRLNGTTCQVVFSVAAAEPTRVAPAPKEPARATSGTAAKPEKKGEGRTGTQNDEEEDEDEPDEDEGGEE